MKKLSLSLLSVGLLAAVLVGAVLIFFVSKLPAQSGVQKIAGLSAQTKIIRDNHGVPHIFAETLNDGFAALGYLHASDRMFQMEMMRRAGSGRLAEILGSDLINYDKKMRALGFYRLIEPYYKGLSADTREALDAYARGVNAVMAKGNFAAEFTLLGFEPTEWKPWDGLIWAKMMAWQLSGNYEDEVYREALLKHGLSKAQIGAMYPVMDKNVPSTMKPLEWIMRDKRRGMRDEEERSFSNVVLPKELNQSPLIPDSSSLIPHFDRLPRTASNAYVIAGAHTKNGKPILANDPHLQLQSPILWYLARIVTPQGELKGATAAGMPFFPLGQNSHVAWGFTTSNIDVQDMTFIASAAKEFRLRHETIHVKDGADVRLDVEENDDGVIINNVIASVHDATPQHKKALLQFTGLSAEDRTAQALYRINTASDAAAIEAALKDYSVPPQNILYADDAGHIGYAAVGAIPKRSNDGFYANENRVWQGMMAQTPHLKNPKAGVILNANQAIVDDKVCAAFSCNFARDWAEPYRAMRMEEWFLQQLKNKMDVVDASGAMLDITSHAAERFLPTMLQGATGKTVFEKDILSALSRWDGRMARDKPEPLVYHAWLDALMRLQFSGHYASDVLWPRMWALEHQSISTDVIQTAFNTALAGLTTKYRAAWQTWRWGDEHIAPLKHPLWSHVPVLNQLTSLAIETDGDGHTLQRAAPLDYTSPFLAEHGAGYRGVYDVGNPAQSLFMMAGGQSGQLLSPHYGNLREDWSNGNFITLTGDEATLMNSSKAVLTLTP